MHPNTTGIRFFWQLNLTGVLFLGLAGSGCSAAATAAPSSAPAPPQPQVTNTARPLYPMLMTPQFIAPSTRQPTAAPPMKFTDLYSLERSCEMLLEQGRRAVVDGSFRSRAVSYRTNHAPFYCTASLAQERGAATVWLRCSAAANGICEEDYLFLDFDVCDRLGVPLEAGQTATVTLEARLMPGLTEEACGLVVVDMTARRD